MSEKPGLLTDMPLRILSLFFVLSSGAFAAEPVELVLRGGVVVTCDAKNSQAQAIAASKGRIVAVGSNADVQPLIGQTTRVIDLAGRVVTPGFIECHGHLLSLGQQRIDVDLAQCKTWEECVAKVAERVQSVRKGDWIVGRGWHQEHWTNP